MQEQKKQDIVDHLFDLISDEKVGATVKEKFLKANGFEDIKGSLFSKELNVEGLNPSLKASILVNLDSNRSKGSIVVFSIKNEEGQSLYHKRIDENRVLEFDLKGNIRRYDGYGRSIKNVDYPHLDSKANLILNTEDLLLN